MKTALLTILLLLFILPSGFAQYGEIYKTNDTGYVIESPGQDVYKKVTGLGSERLYEVNATNSSLIINTGGVYALHWHMAFGGGLSDEYEITVFNDGAELEQCEQHRKLGTGGDVGSASGHCLINTTTGDVLTLQFKNLDDAVGVTYNNANMNIHYLEVTNMIENIPALTYTSDAYQPIFIIVLLLMIALTVLKIYNVMRLSSVYGWRISFILWIVALISFGVGMVIGIIYYNNILIIQLLRFMTFGLLINSMMFIIEIIQYTTNAAKTRKGARYNPDLFR